MYLTTKSEAREAVYVAKFEAEKNRFSDFSWRDDQKGEVFKISKRMLKLNQDIICEYCA